MSNDQASNYTPPTDPKTIEDFNLSPFEVDFVTHYFSSDSGAEAARKAGSTAKRPEAVAYNTLQRPNVQAAINWGMKNRIEAAGIDSRAIISMLKTVYNEALAAGKYNDANKAAELLGNHLGMFRTSQVVETAIKSDAHKTSNDKKDLQNDILRFVKVLKN